MAQKPLLGQGLLIIEVSRSQIYHSWLDHLDEGSTRRRDLFLTSHERAIHAPRGIRTRNPSKKRPQTHALDRAATGTGIKIIISR